LISKYLLHRDRVRGKIATWFEVVENGQLKSGLAQSGRVNFQTGGS
jgi:hypothetical protein